MRKTGLVPPILADYAYSLLIAVVIVAGGFALSAAFLAAFLATLIMFVTYRKYARV